MTVKFFITIDTEEDGWGRFETSGHSVENVKQLPYIQEIFDRYEAFPTYLVTYSVIKDDRARQLLLDIFSRNRCEIGTHCHPWNTPPFKEELNERNSMLSNLPYDLVAQKIKTLHREIIESFRVIPRCFRAGRFGFNSNVAKIIHDLGYLVDTSVTPFIDWDIYEGPDYQEAPQNIYRFNPEAVLTARSDGCLLEIPVTIGFLQNNFALRYRMMKLMSNSIVRNLHLMGILDRLKFLNFRWLSPEVSSGKDMVALVKTCLHQHCSHLCMMFHSTSLLPGESSFVRTQSDLESFLGSIIQILQFAANEGLVFSPLSGILEEYPSGSM